MSSVLKKLRERAEMMEHDVSRDVLRAAKGLLVEPFRMDRITKKERMQHLTPLSDLVWTEPSLENALAFVRGHLGASINRRQALVNLRWLQKYG